MSKISAEAGLRQRDRGLALRADTRYAKKPRA